MAKNKFEEAKDFIRNNTNKFRLEEYVGKKGKGLRADADLIKLFMDFFLKLLGRKK